jgi:hypothetical protein
MDARRARRGDLGTIEAVEKKVAAIRNAFLEIAEIDGVRDALALVDQLDDAVADIAADVEMELHERRDRKGR